jgi:hypothetical protein
MTSTEGNIFSLVISPAYSYLKASTGREDETRRWYMPVDAMNGRQV